MFSVIYWLPKENQNYVRNYKKNFNYWLATNFMFRYFENPVTFGDCFN